MCVAELLWRGAYPRQSVGIKPDFKVFPLSWLLHETKVYYDFVYCIIYYSITDRTATQTEPGGSRTSWTAWVTALWPCCLGDTKDPRLPSLGDTAPWPAAVPSIVRVAGCWMLCCSWGETPPWKTWHSCAMEAEASHHAQRNFWRGYMGQAFSTWSHQIYCCQQLSNIWASWKGMSCAKERWVEGRCMQSLEEFVS